jgi:hypothetical protein
MDESVHILAGAYAVDALDDQERASFEVHLAGCAECTAEVRDLRAAAARLGSAQAVWPPERLKADVLARVAVTAQLPPLPAATEPAAPAAADGGAGRHRTQDLSHRRRSGAAGWLAAAAVLLLVVVVALGTTLGVLLAHARNERAAAQAESRAVASVLTAPDAHTAAAPVSGGGTAAVVVSEAQGSAVFLADGLAQPSSGHLYELWFITAAGAATPAGTFVPASDGGVVQRLTGSPNGASVVGVTVEPDPGSAQPTTKPVVAVPLSG